MTDRPSIDHALLSPSGRMSRRAREAALKIEAARLFPPGYWDTQSPDPVEETRQKALGLRRSAANLRDLASRGMNSRAYLRKAAALEAEADQLEETFSKEHSHD